MRNYSVIGLIDNTKSGNFLDAVNLKGYSHLSKQKSPNKGKILSSSKFSKDNICYFNEQNLIKLEEDFNKYAIHNSSIFMMNNKLQKKGVIVRRHQDKQDNNGFIFRTQDWFEIVDSNCAVSAGLIIVRARTAVRFNNDDLELRYFVSEDNILININDGIFSGPAFKLIEIISDGFTSFKKRGLLNEEVVHFTEHEFSFMLGDKKYYLVKNENIIAKELHQRPIQE